LGYKFQALLKGCVNRGAKRLRVHVLLDGRDVAPGSAIKYVEALESELAELRKGGIDAWIASGGGRMAVTMDRYEVSYMAMKLYIVFEKLMCVCVFFSPPF
jgi:2,3-bisphosphoglycerate-independent phosphoglycerate mutase